MGILAGLLGFLLAGSYALVPADESEIDTVSDEGLEEENTGPDLLAEAEDGGSLSSDEMASLLDPQEEALDEEVSEDTAPLILDASMQITGDETDNILTGQGGANTLEGEGGTDLMNGYASDDQISGGSGDDTLHGASGDDQISGDAGDDVIHGESGDDHLQGGEGHDDLSGHFGDDTLDGDAGADTLTGGAGEDSLAGGAGDDALHGNKDDDTLDGGAGQDALFGGEGNDLLIGAEEGESEQDFLNAGSGDDTMVLGGQDVATGSEGNDTFILGDWIADGQIAVVQGFDTNEDALVVVYDDANYSEMPSVTAAPDGGNADVTHISLNGTVIASLQGVSGLSSDGFMVISYSDAVTAGMLTAA